MAITVKDITEILGLKDIDEAAATPEEIKTALDAKFVSREYAPKDDTIRKAVFGKLVGEARTKVKQLGEFDSKEIDGIDLIPAIEKLDEKYKNQIAALKESGVAGKDKRVSDLEKLLEDKEKSLKAFKEGLEEKENKINELTTSYTENLKSYKTNHKLDEIKSKLPFVEDYSKKDVLRTGFEGLVKQRAKFSLNERDELEVYTPDGNPIKHPKKTGEFLKPDEFLLQLAEEQGLIKKNNSQEKKAPLIIPGFNDKPDPSGQTKSKVHPKARQKASEATA